jgi:Cd2+/Zn2+-exporting ATPase
MLTGDGDRVAKSVATAVGIEEVHADLSPDDKAASILRLRNRHGLTAMVGDGLNDAHADVGIAMGQKSSGIALETADVVLMSDSLEQLPFLVQHARRPLAVIRQNIIFALLTKAIFLLLAAGGCRYVVDGDGDRGGQRRATLLVILNGLRLLRVRSNMLRDADC